VGQPCWTVKDQQKITQYIFEKFRPPAFTIADSALCALFAHGNVDNACVVDVGFEKADVTAIVNYNIHLSGRQIAVPDCGGDAFTARLQELLASKKWSREMCEQLKKSAICEILPPGIPLPGTKEAEKADKISNPASAASTGASASGPGHRDTAGAAGDLPLGPGPGTQVGSEAVLDGNEEGVLDIAKIVGSGSTKDFIAQKEKEKSEKVALKKGQKLNAAEQAQQNKNARMLNRDRATASFIYSDYAFLDAIKGNKSMTAEERTQAHAAVDEGSKQTQAEKSAAAEHTTGNAMDVDAPKTGISSLIHTKAPRRELEVGNERFQAATGGAIDRIADAIQRTISSVNEVAKRSELWDNLVIVGNGAKIRGKSIRPLGQNRQVLI
jgi:actin-related protein 9